MDEWGWRPEMGRWRLDRYGYPQRPTFVSISTNGVPASSAYEYWRNIAFSDFEADRQVGSGPFQARASGLTSQSHDFFDSDSGAISGARRKREIDQDGLDGISLGLVTRGRRWAELASGEQQTSGAGELFAYDAARAGTVRWTAHRSSYLVIRREEAREVLGPTLPSPVELTRRVAASPVRHLIADQLRGMARHHSHLSQEEQAFLLGQASKLMLFAMARQSANDQPMIDSRAIFHTALRYISTNLADPALDTDRVAAALRVSRATLYRSFRQQDLGVAEAIRDLRLDRARNLLEHAQGNLTITEVALHCGLYDTTNFSRAFRRRFGFSPSYLRRSE